MKILFFIESLHSGGKERRLVELLKALSQNPEFEVELVITKGDIHYKEVNVLNIKIHLIKRIFKKDPLIFLKFFQIARKFDPHIIHVWGNLAAIYAIPAKLILNIPMINSQITSAKPFVKGGLLSHELSFKFSDLIISNSKAGLRSYGMDNYKSKVIYNGFDFSRIDNLKNKNRVKDQFGINENNVVGMVASFTTNKDYETFLEVARITRKKRTDIAFIAVGDGPLRKDLQEKYGSDLNSSGIYFLGKQSEVESTMNICNIGVLTTYTEGISNSLLEFMALGKPVIATDGGGTNELVIDGVSGYLIKKEAILELADKINNLLNDNTLQIAMGENARRRVTENFNIQIMTDLFIKSYKKFVRL